MAFQVRCNFAHIHSYAEAVKAWKTGVIFPKDRKLNLSLAPRGLVDIRKKHLTVERTEAEDIILRLYKYPVVTWHKDNSVTVCSFKTRSTTVFGNHCTPAGMYLSFGDHYFAVTVDGRTYKVDEHITFRQRDNTWKADKITPWSVPVVNRERAKQALHETGYKGFRLWLKVYVQMAAKPDGQAVWVTDDSMILMLRDRSKWRDLIACRFQNAWNRPDYVLSEIRKAIYVKYDCIEDKSVAFLSR